nr:PREDICTED: uncharacterized protein LOC105074112 [Camelus bactrianus]
MLQTPREDGIQRRPQAPAPYLKKADCVHSKPPWLLCAAVFCTRHWFGARGPVLGSGSCNKEEDEQSLPWRGCSPAKNAKRQEEVGVKKEGRHLASRRWPDFPWDLEEYVEKNREQVAQTEGLGGAEGKFRRSAGLGWRGTCTRRGTAGLESGQAAWWPSTGGDCDTGLKERTGTERELNALSGEDPGQRGVFGAENHHFLTADCGPHIILCT